MQAQLANWEWLASYFSMRLQLGTASLYKVPHKFQMCTFLSGFLVQRGKSASSLLSLV